MPFPFIALGTIGTIATYLAGGAAAAYTAKKIYDAVTDDNGGGSYVSEERSGPSREEVCAKQKKELIAQLEKDVFSLWEKNNHLLCLKNKTASDYVRQLSCEVTAGKKNPSNALQELFGLEAPKELIAKRMMLDEPEAFLGSSTLTSIDGLVDTLNFYFKSKNDHRGDSALQMGLADNYEICKSEGESQELKRLFAPGKKRQGLDALPAKFKSTLSGLEAPWNRAKNIIAVAQECKEPRVVVCGMLKAGKSSLLNSLFEDVEDTTFKVGATRTTMKNQRLLKNGICFIDTPGLEANKEDTDEAKAVYPTADLLLFVHTGERELIIQELEFLKSLTQTNSGIERRLIAVISHCDLANDHLDELKTSVSGQIEQVLGHSVPLFSVSNSRYRKGIQTGKEKLRELSGIDELRQFIFEKCASEHEAMSAERELTLEQSLKEIEYIIDGFSKKVANKRKSLNDFHKTIFKEFKNNIINPAKKQLKELS